MRANRAESPCKSLVLAGWGAAVRQKGDVGKGRDEEKNTDTSIYGGNFAGTEPKGIFGPFYAQIIPMQSQCRLRRGRGAGQLLRFGQVWRLALQASANSGGRQAGAAIRR